MKRILYIILIIFILGIFLKACIKKDTGLSDYTYNFDTSKINKNAVKINLNYPIPKTKTINGTDYLQSQLPVGKFGDKIVSSLIGEGPKTFNPFTASDATSSQMAELMYDGLFSVNPMTGDVIPRLAKNVEINGNKYIVTLRKGISWSDGQAITAKDVYFTWNDIIFAGLGNTSIRDSMVIDGELPKIKILNDYKVEFVIKKQFAPFLRLLSAPIAPKHYFAKDKNWQKNFYQFLATNTNPQNIVSSGAFRLKEYVPAQRIVFEKNNNYYLINKDNQKLPYINKLIYLIVGDLNNQILKFEGKEIDVISLRGGDVARYKANEINSDYTVYNLGSDTGTMFLTINMNNRFVKNGKLKKYYVNPVKQRWFRDINFRKAIDYAVDRESMVNNVANGLAEPLFTAESKNSVFYNSSIKGHKRDIKKSLNLLKASGFKLKNGILYDKFNNVVEVNLYTNAGNTEREAIGVMIKQDLADIGIKVNFKPIEFNSLVNKISNSFDWDMIIIGLTGSPVEPHNGKNVWYSSGSLHLFNQRAINMPVTDKLDWEDKIDKIFDMAATELNIQKRKKYYNEYQKIIYNEAPVIYLYSPTRIYAVRNRIKNLYPSTLSGIMYNLDEIYIDRTVDGRMK